MYTLVLFNPAEDATIRLIRTRTAKTMNIINPITTCPETKQRTLYHPFFPSREVEEQTRSELEPQIAAVAAIAAGEGAGDRAVSPPPSYNEAIEMA